jgi:hypothetical protein
MARLGKSEEEMKGIIDEVLKLNPKPGGTVSDPYANRHSISSPISSLRSLTAAWS